jgi:hypothetical protein
MNQLESQPADCSSRRKEVAEQGIGYPTPRSPSSAVWPSSARPTFCKTMTTGPGGSDSLKTETMKRENKTALHELRQLTRMGGKKDVEFVRFSSCEFAKCVWSIRNHPR